MSIEKLFQRLSYVCGAISIFMGSIFIIWWYTLGKALPLTIGISFPGSIAFILIGFGLFSLYFTKWNWLTNIVGFALVLISLLKHIHIFLFQGTFLDNYSFFAHANPLNLIGFGLIGTLFSVWTQKKETVFLYPYGFFIGFTCIGISILGLLAYLFGFSAIYGNTHFFGLITLLFAGIGVVSSIVYFERIHKVNLAKWIPLTVGMTFLIFAAFLTAGLILNQDAVPEKKFNSLLIGYASVGGVLFSMIAAYLSYFWLLSYLRLKEVSHREKEIQEAKESMISTLKAAEVGVWKYEISKNLFEFDKTTRDFFEIKPEIFQGNLKELTELIHPEDRIFFRSALEKSLKTHESYDIEFRVIQKNRQFRFLHGKGSFFLDLQKNTSYLSGVVYDITTLKYSENLLKISEGVAKIFGKAELLSEAVEQIFKLFQRYFGWEMMALWMRKSSNDPFVLITLQSTDSFQAPEFVKATKEIRSNTLDRVISSFEEELTPQTIQNIGEDPHYFRSPIALKEGVKGGLIFPIAEGSSLQGIIEFFKKDEYLKETDPMLSNLLGTISIGIGEFVRRKQAEYEAGELAKIFTLSTLPMFTCTVEGNILNWNAAAEKTFGWKEKEIVGQNHKILYPKDRLAEAEMLSKAFSEGKDVIGFQTQRITKDKTIVSVENTYSIISNTDKAHTKVVVIVRDITKEQKAIEALAKAESKFKDFVETTEEWIWEMDLRGHFIYSNPAVKDLLGYSVEEVTGQPIYLFVPEKSRSEIEMQIEKASRSKMGWSHSRMIVKSKNGKEKILESSALPILDEKKEIIGFRGTSRDITERETLEKSKNDFISMISHEIRTPLTSIHGALGLLSVQGDLPQKTQNLIALAYRNSDLLSRLILDIIDIEKIESERFDYQINIVSLAEVIQESINSIIILQEKRKEKIVIESILPEVKIKADRERLIQVLFNLISNAIKFSPPEGQIFISMDLLGNRVRVSVRDEGIGIPEEFKDRIFGRFEQVDPKSGKPFRASGLGLNIAKKIVEQMGGSIGYTSELGKGTTFYFEFPVITI